MVACLKILAGCCVFGLGDGCKAHDPDPPTETRIAPTPPVQAKANEVIYTEQVQAVLDADWEKFTFGTEGEFDIKDLTYKLGDVLLFSDDRALKITGVSDYVNVESGARKYFYRNAVTTEIFSSFDVRMSGTGATVSLLKQERQGVTAYSPNFRPQKNMLATWNPFTSGKPKFVLDVDGLKLQIGCINITATSGASMAPVSTEKGYGINVKYAPDGINYSHMELCKKKYTGLSLDLDINIDPILDTKLEVFGPEETDGTRKEVTRNTGLAYLAKGTVKYTKTSETELIREKILIHEIKAPLAGIPGIRLVMVIPIYVTLDANSEGNMDVTAIVEVGNTYFSTEKSTYITQCFEKYCADDLVSVDNKKNNTGDKPYKRTLIDLEAKAGATIAPGMSIEPGLRAEAFGAHVTAGAYVSAKNAITLTGTGKYVREQINGVDIQNKSAASLCVENDLIVEYGGYINAKPEFLLIGGNRRFLISQTKFPIGSACVKTKPKALDISVAINNSNCGRGAPYVYICPASSSFKTSYQWEINGGGASRFLTQNQKLQATSAVNTVAKNRVATSASADGIALAWSNGHGGISIEDTGGKGTITSQCQNARMADVACAKNMSVYLDVTDSYGDKVRHTIVFARDDAPVVAAKAVLLPNGNVFLDASGTEDEDSNGLLKFTWRFKNRSLIINQTGPVATVDASRFNPNIAAGEVVNIKVTDSLGQSANLDVTVIEQSSRETVNGINFEDTAVVDVPVNVTITSTSTASFALTSDGAKCESLGSSKFKCVFSRAGKVPVSVVQGGLKIYSSSVDVQPAGSIQVSPRQVKLGQATALTLTGGQASKVTRAEMSGGTCAAPSPFGASTSVSCTAGVAGIRQITLMDASSGKIGDVSVEVLPESGGEVYSVSPSFANINEFRTFEIVGKDMPATIKVVFAPCTNISVKYPVPGSKYAFTCTPTKSGTHKLSIQDGTGGEIYSKFITVNGISLNTPPTVSGFNANANSAGIVSGSLTVADAEGDQITNLRVHVGKTAGASDCMIDIGTYTGLQSQGFKTYSGNCATVLTSSGPYYAKVEAADSKGAKAVVKSASFYYTKPSPSGSFSLSSNVGTGGNSVTVTVTGANLTTDTAFSIQDFASCTKDYRNDSLIYFYCTVPSNVSPGGRWAILKHAPGGDVLYGDQYNTWFSIRSRVTAINASTYRKGSITTLTVSGSNFPSTVAIAIQDCDASVGGTTFNSPTEAILRCRLGPTTGSKSVAVKNQSGGTPLETIVNMAISVTN